jgi:hypothetical protein
MSKQLTQPTLDRMQEQEPMSTPNPRYRVHEFGPPGNRSWEVYDTTTYRRIGQLHLSRQSALDYVDALQRTLPPPTHYIASFGRYGAMTFHDYGTVRQHGEYDQPGFYATYAPKNREPYQIGRFDTLRAALQELELWHTTIAPHTVTEPYVDPAEIATESEPLADTPF